MYVYMQMTGRNLMGKMNVTLFSFTPIVGKLKLPTQQLSIYIESLVFKNVIIQTN